MRKQGELMGQSPRDKELQEQVPRMKRSVLEGRTVGLGLRSGGAQAQHVEALVLIPSRGKGVWGWCYFQTRKK